VAEKTSIEWTHHTFNPWWGCQKVSPGCDHCYAETLDRRTGGAHWGPHAERRLTKDWSGPRRWNKRCEKLGTRERVFCASMADVFDNAVPAEWRVQLFALIRETPNLDWLLLTKRPQNIEQMFPLDWWDCRENVWIGTTVENQEEAKRRIPHLLAVPARVHFLSCEPLLGPLDLRRWIEPPRVHHHPSNDQESTAVQALVEVACRKLAPRIDWVIAGGESGPRARPLSTQWARELRDQCKAAGVPFLWKQWGEWAPAGPHRSEDEGRFAFGDYEHDRTVMVETDHYPRQFTRFGARSVMERVGKARAGRLLDGALHDAYPQVRS
jgi:protein gp37